MGSEYVRNDTANNIADGNVISAADFDGEFDKLVTAFTAGTGHSHDGTTGEGGYVTKLLGTAITIGDGTAGTDIAVTFDGETNDGVLTWMEDEDRFDFADKVKIVDATDVDVSDTTVGSLVTNGGLVVTKDLLVGDDIFLDSDSSVVKFGADQDITLTHAADTSLALGGAGGTTGLIINNTATDGDPFLAFALSGTQTFTMGVDDGDSDKFKIGTSAIGTSTILTLTGDDMILADDLSLQSDGAILNFGADDDISVTHTADTSLTLGGAGGTTGLIVNNTAGDGDPFLAFALSGTQTFTMGVDDGDSDKFKIGTSAIGTNTRLTIDSSGNSEFSGAITAGGDVTAKTGDGAILALQTSLDTVIDGSVLGTIQFKAPEEASDTDSRELAAEIAAVAEEAFSTTSNATELVFKTGASEAATSKMVLSSTGILSVNGGVIPTSADGAALGSATKEWSDLYLADSGVIYFGDDQDTTLTHTDGTGLTLNGTNKLTFGDAASFIHQSSDGVMTIDGEASVNVNATTAVTITTPSLIITDNTTDEPIVQIKNTHNGTTAGELRFVMDKGSAGADGDDLGTISFYGDDAGQNQTAFAKIVGEVSEADDSDEAGKLSFYVAESDGTNTALTAGLVLEGEHATDGEVDVTIGAGTASTTTVAGSLVVTTSVEGGVVFNEDSADVDFRIESNGNANMFFVDGGNDRIGINTNSPPANHTVHIQSGGYRSDGSDSIGLLVGADIGATTLTDSTRKIGGISFPHYDNDEPPFNAIRVDSQSTTSVMSIGGTGETNGVERIEFYCAATDTDASTLKIRGTFNPSGFFKATNSGDFYNGTDATSGAWHEVNSDIANEQLFAITSHNTGTDNEGLVIRHVANTNNTSSGFISCANDVNGTKFAVKGNGDVQSATSSYGSTSDERLKSDIKDANSQWDDIKQFRFRNFKKYDTEDLVHLGLIAQEAEKISQNIISDTKPSKLDIKHDASFGTLYEDGDDIPDGKQVGDVKEIKEKVKGIKYSVLYMKAVKALQEAMARIETLETKVKALEDA